MADEQQSGAWNYVTPILTGMASAAIQGIYNNYAVNKQNKFNTKEAEKARQFEMQMSNTAYQRGYADMAAAGLNPHLAGGQGGASTPAGTAATGAQAMPLDAVGAINAASNVALTRAQLSNIEADTDLKGAQTGKTEVERNGIEIENKYKDAKQQLEIMLGQTTNKKLKADIEKTMAETAKIEKEVAKMDDEIAILKSEGKIKEAEAKTKVRNRRAYAALEMTESATRSIGNLTGAVKGTKFLPNTSQSFSTVDMIP